MQVWRNWQYAQDLDSCGEIRAGSNPATCTSQMPNAGIGSGKTG